MDFQYRGRKIGSREWVYGRYIPGDDPQIVTQRGMMARVYPNTVGLCSGQKDKRRNLIYTGQKVVDEDGVAGVVVFANAAFRVDVNGGAFLKYNSSLLVRDGLESGRFKIVGDIC